MKKRWVLIYTVFFLLAAGCGSHGSKGEADGGIGDGGQPDATECVPTCPEAFCGDDGCGSRCICPQNLACNESTDQCGRQGRSAVSMRDGIRLDTHVLLPASGDGPWPVILKRTPYILRYGEYVFYPFQPFTDDGYALVVQACRGTGESEGELRPLAQEFEDGHDAAEWAASQPWSNGRVGTLGASYEGFTALAAAIDTESVKVVITDGSPAHAFEGWPGYKGITTTLLWWLHMVKTGENLATDLDFLTVTTNHRPVMDLDLAAFGGPYPIWRSTLPYMGQWSQFWADMSLDGRLDRLCAPVVHLQARMEAENDAMDVFLEVTGSPCSAEVSEAQRFVLGSHDHAEAAYSPFEQGVTGDLIQAYLAKYLKEENIDLSGIPQIQYHIRNTNEWREADQWPVATSVAELFIHPSSGPQDPGDLLPAPPTTDGTSTFLYDPATDDACDENVYTGFLYFEGVAESEPFDLVGGVEVLLFVSVDAPDTDIFASLYEVTSQDEWEMIHFSQMRMRYRDSYENPAPLTPGEPVEVRITLPVTAIRIQADSRLALFLSGSACGLSENTNTFGSVTEETNTRAAAISILSGPDHPSRIRIPVLDPP